MSLAANAAAAPTDARLCRHPLGFLQVRDMPDGEALRAYYADRYFQTEQSTYRAAYAPNERAWFDIKHERLVALVAAARPQPPGRLLDVGCGEGFAMAKFAERGWQVSGLDYGDAGMAAMNPQLLPVLETGDVQERLRAYQLRGSQYDVLLLANVLEHVPDPPALLHALRGLQAPGGVCVVVVPNDGSVWQEYLLAAGHISHRFWISIPDHLAYFDAASLRATASATGWTCQRLLADVPIDWLLANPHAEYVGERHRGRAAHEMRMSIDTVLSHQPMEAVLDFYEAMAKVGMGRQLIAVLA